MDINDMPVEQVEDAAARAVWQALPKAVRADISNRWTPEQKAEVRKGFARAKNLPRD